MKKILCLLVVAILFIVGSQIGMVQEAQVDKYAVVIGIGHQGSQKVAGDRVARAITALLKENGFQAKNIKQLMNNKATLSNVLDALQWLGQQEGEVVFFFGGHGGSNGVSLWDTYMRVAEYPEFYNWVSEKQLVMIDACYSGYLALPLADEHRISYGSTFAQSVSSHHSLTDWAYSFLRKIEQGMSVTQALGNGDNCIDNYDKEYWLGKD